MMSRLCRYSIGAALALLLLPLLGLADGPSPFARAPYLLGVQSGLGDMHFRVLIDGVPTDPPATLAEPYTESISVASHRFGGGDTVHYGPGVTSVGHLVLRRKVSTDKSWIQWALSASSNRAPVRHDIDLVLTRGDIEICRWSTRHAFASKYSLTLADDGRPVEELTAEVDPTTRLVRKRGEVEEATSPIGSGTQTGFISGLGDNAMYEVAFAGTPYPDYLIASDTGFHFDVLTYRNGGLERQQKFPGTLHQDWPTLRENPTANPFLFDWYAAIANGHFSTATMDLAITGETSIPLIRYSHAWPHSYKLQLADDGLPIEDLEVVYELPAVQAPS